MYITIALSAIHTNAGSFLHPDYVDSLWQTEHQQGIITLCRLYYQYARFRDDAISNGQLTVSDDQFYDQYVDGVWQKMKKEDYKIK